MNLPQTMQRNSAPNSQQSGKASAKVSNKKNSRQLWWQKSIVRRSLSSIEPDLDHVISKSPFLRQQHAKFSKADVGIALFERSEIHTGQLLGKGGFSFVYEVTGISLDARVTATLSQEERNLRQHYADTVVDERTGACRYCIKHLQDRLIEKPKDFQCAASDLAVEAAFLQAVDHPHILKIRALPASGLDAWKDGKHDGYFILTDRLEDTLDKRIQKWKKQGDSKTIPAINERCRYALELADALKYLHENRIVFRDLKPHNIGFDMAGRIKLFDFGLCRELPDVESSLDGLYQMSGVGTRRYMAVEIINTGRYNLKADVYGWSMILWELLSLQKPYAPYSTDDHRREVCVGGERPKLNSQWPVWIQSLLRVSWDEAIKYRFTMQEAYDGLKAGMMLEMDGLNVSNHAVQNYQQPLLHLPRSPTGAIEFSPEMAEHGAHGSCHSNHGTQDPPTKRTVYLKLAAEAQKISYLEIEDSFVDAQQGNNKQDF